MKKINNFLVIAIILISFISCNSNSNKNNGDVNGVINEIKNSDDYFPLSTGMKREYKLIYSTPFKNVDGKAIMRIEDMENINGKEYYKMIYVYSSIPGLESETYFYRKSNDGYYALKQINGSLSEEYLDFKLPLEIGTSWKSFSPDGEFEYIVQGIETLELIDKKYKDCLKITVKRKEGGSGYMFLYKGIGLIKYFIQIRTDESYEYTLID